MTVLEICKYGDPVLREKAQPIREITDELRQLAADMGDTMYSAGGIGLAGNQVGVLQRILVIDITDSDERRESGKRQPPRQKNLEVYLNAEILSASDEDAPYNEGCLSIPVLEGEVYRPVRIKMRWMDLEGQTHEAEFDDLRARVLQHEIDHLDGVLFIDHIGAIARRMMAGKLNKMKKETLARLEEKAGQASNV